MSPGKSRCQGKQEHGCSSTCSAGCAGTLCSTGQRKPGAGREQGLLPSPGFSIPPDSQEHCAGSSSLVSQLDTTLCPGSLGASQLQGPHSPVLQPRAPAVQLWVSAAAWEVLVRLPKSRSLQRQHHPHSPPARLAQQGVPRGAGEAAAKQVLDGCWSKQCSSYGRKPTA